MRKHLLTLSVVALLALALAACGAPEPTPIPTPIPPTRTATSTPTPTATPTPTSTPTATATATATPTSTPTPTLTSTPIPTPTSTLTPTPTPTTGAITGMVLDASGKPLVNIYDQETLIVALFCPSDDTDIECLHEDFWDMDMDVLLDSICGAEDTAENCILHLGQGATSVEADGSYTLTDIPPGQYGLVFIFSGPGLMQCSLKRDVKPVQVGETSEYDIKTDLHRRE